MRTVLTEWQVRSAELQQPADPASSEIIRWRDPSGPLVIARAGDPELGHYRLRDGDRIVVDILPDRRIEVRSRPGTAQSTIDHFLGDQVYPRMLASEGRLVVHAAALRSGSHSFLLVGASGRGKSTLATSFALDGNDLLGDDATIIDEGAAGPTAEAVYPSLRLLPDSIAALLPDDVEAFAIAPYTAKQRIAVPIARQATPGALPIAAIFLIGEPAGAALAERASVKAACMALVESSFALDPADVEQARLRLVRASRIAAAVPAFRLCYPRDYARLAEVHRIIRSTLAALNEGTDRR